MATRWSGGGEQDRKLRRGWHAKRARSSPSLVVIMHDIMAVVYYSRPSVTVYCEGYKGEQRTHKDKILQESSVLIV